MHVFAISSRMIPPFDCESINRRFAQMHESVRNSMHEIVTIIRIRLLNGILPLLEARSQNQLIIHFIVIPIWMRTLHRPKPTATCFGIKSRVLFSLDDSTRSKSSHPRRTQHKIVHDRNAIAQHFRVLCKCTSDALPVLAYKMH